MATLTTAEKASIANLLVYLKNGYEKPNVDEVTVEVLTPMAEKFGFTGPGTPGLQDALRDAPFSTLLTCLLAVAA